MNQFSWYEASSVDEALKEVNATVSESLTKGGVNGAVLKAGGVDLLDLMKEGLVQPEKVVNIRNIESLRGITYDKKSGLRIGSNTTLGEMGDNEVIKSQYLALHQSVMHAATPQLRNMASLGGNLAQRTRCWYFRSADHPCFRKGGDTCFAKKGENEMHAILKNGGCCSVHASSIATALLVFDSRVEIMDSEGKKREVALDGFFVHPGDDASKENILKANELITAVILPPLKDNVKSFYIKKGPRESYDWALADVAVKAVMKGDQAKNVSVALGAAAPIPILSEAAAAALEGKSISEETAMNAGKKAMENAQPLAQNGYKVLLFESVIKHAVMGLV
jgi:xanthine dehydrogenase YagS FAD-binding subunit